MKKFQKWERFPLGSIRPQGFLREQLLRGKDGMAGHLFELEPQMIYDPFVHKTYVPAWGDGDQSGWGAEISGNYWTGYIEHAFTLGDEQMIAIATDWVNKMLKNQKADGYLGTYFEEDADIYQDYNAWGTSCVMPGLIAFYEVTGRRDVLDAVHRCLLWFVKTWDGNHKTVYAAPAIIETMVLVYFLTEDERLLHYAEEYLEYVADHDIFSQSYRTYLNGRMRYFSNHTAAVGTQSRLPAVIYQATGREECLRATIRALHDCYRQSVHYTGGPVSVNEYLGPTSGITETEYCSYANFTHTYSLMSCITGDSWYGDRMEELFYNGAQGARKKDERAIAYLSSPNQIYATDQSAFAGESADMQVYAPCYRVSCCPVNAVVTPPRFIRGMLLHNSAGDVCVMAYGPCTLSHGDTHLRVETEYPFRHNVRIVMACDKTFGLSLRVPAFATSVTLTVNGEVVEAVPEDGFITLRRDWRVGDAVSIAFGAEVEILKVNDIDMGGKYPLAIRYGTLVYSFPVPENWVAYPGRPMTPLPEGWSWYNVKAHYEEAPVPDSKEQMGLRKHQFSWNFALDPAIRPCDVRVEEIETDGYAWEEPKVKLHLTAYKAPYLYSPYHSRTHDPFYEFNEVTHPMEVSLVPHGCTNLRITYFPKAKL